MKGDCQECIGNLFFMCARYGVSLSGERVLEFKKKTSILNVHKIA